VEEAFLEGSRLRLAENFFAPRGSAKLMFFYQEVEAQHDSGKMKY